MTPQYPQFELWWSSVSTLVSIIPASNVKMMKHLKDAIDAKHGIEKTGVDIGMDVKNTV